MIPALSSDTGTEPSAVDTRWEVTIGAESEDKGSQELMKF
jgi:hypothetical protein